MHHTVLSEQMFELLSAHVAEIEMEKESIIKSFYADNAGSGMDIESFFREYTSTIENYLKSVKSRKDGMNSCPMAIIGSTVEVRDTTDMDIYSYHIVLPYAKKTGKDINHASCLSPLGRALLLKTAGSRVSIKTPTDLLSYEILSITLPEPVVQDNTIHNYKGAANIAF